MSTTSSFHFCITDHRPQYKKRKLPSPLCHYYMGVNINLFFFSLVQHSRKSKTFFQPWNFFPIILLNIPLCGTVDGTRNQAFFLPFVSHLDSDFYPQCATRLHIKGTWMSEKLDLNIYGTFVHILENSNRDYWVSSAEATATYVL